MSGSDIPVEAKPTEERRQASRLAWGSIGGIIALHLYVIGLFAYGVREGLLSNARGTEFLAGHLWFLFVYGAVPVFVYGAILGALAACRSLKVVAWRPRLSRSRWRRPRGLWPS